MRWLVVVLTGAAIGLAYRYFVDDPSEGNLANYLRSSLHGAGVGTAGWSAHLYLSAQGGAWLRRQPLLVELAFRAVIVALAVSVTIVVLQVAIYDRPLQAAWLADEFPPIVLMAFLVSMVFSAVFEMARLVGGRVLLSIMMGRYRHPTREERILMFLDLVGSTSMAEAMGEVRMHRLLTQLFFEIDEPIVAYGGEVHAYVGDAVIVTWPRSALLEQCLGCFFAVEDRIAEKAESYRRAFGAVPRFRAALHAGPVVISECGDSRRQITYFGDTVNVAARLEEACKESGRSLLASGDFLRGLQPGGHLRGERLGQVQLRGRSAAIEVFAIERDATARA